MKSVYEDVYSGEHIQVWNW